MNLLSDEKVIINSNLECEYEENKFIIFKEDNTNNNIDLINKIYIRENNEFMFKIDFKNSLFNYILKENNIKIFDKIDCEFEFNNNILSLKYKLDEEKRIIIKLL